ncbi:MAG: FtsX-like permease family protein [Lachnospiraceae bacterium]|nr:FtsX-like permease family protein [Lachnospiraceae bacterium]
MKRGFYLRLALDGMRKNKRLYIPYLLTCAGMVMMFYILCGLAFSPLMETFRGGDSIQTVLVLGTFVVGFFALLFLFYTNAFLIRRRNKEFGLYNILGMNKRNISRILLWETIVSSMISLIVGLAGGLLFSKFAELFLIRMAGAEVSYKLTIEPMSILASVIFFGAIFALILLVSLARISLTKPLDLLKSEAAGEKPPKANWFLALAGIIILGVAYYLSVSIESPLAALEVFFLAVLMVIAATYLLFIAGSVVMCRILQKNKKYYYRADHFVSVSSMAFRMKRNGAGLASICILATMVLVMLSSTGCLYFGGENALREMCPYDLSFGAEFSKTGDYTDEKRLEIENIVHEQTGGREKDLFTYFRLDANGLFANGNLEITRESRRLDITTDGELLKKVHHLILISLSDYNRLTGKDLSLEPGEALIWTTYGAYEEDTYTVKGCRTLNVRGALEDIPFKLSSSDTPVAVDVVAVSDWKEYSHEISAYAETLLEDRWIAIPGIYCSFNMPGVSLNEQYENENKIVETCRSMFRTEGYDRFGFITINSYSANRADFFTTYGALFFLGIVLSIVFIAAAALIIYYKQLSEGYEDQSRFGIMQKVGMTPDEIKRAVNSQVLTVFFAPLFLAGIHLAFAFPFVEKILRILGVQNMPLLIAASILCFLAFGLFYIYVFRATARAYYSIVSDEGGN